MSAAPGTRKPKQQDASSSSSPSTLALTPANLRALKRRRTAVEPEQATTPLHPPPTPEVVILRLIELPKLLVVRIVHMIEFHELASLDTSCSAFHPTTDTTEGLTQLSAEMRAQWVLKPWQVATVPRPAGMGWGRWLVGVRWWERVVRASGGRMACGGFGANRQHTLMVSKKGAVMSCGYCFDAWGENDMECPHLGHGKGGKSQSLLKTLEALKGEKVVQVSAGYRHSLVLTNSGDVFSFGLKGSMLGHGDGDRKNQYLPKLVESLKGKKVVQVSAGAWHSLILTDSGDVFSFGYGNSGRLGHGDTKDENLPKLVEALKGKKVVQVSAGSFHSLMLTESGDVFSFGGGRFGQLGHGDRKSRHLPKLVEALKGKKVVQVSAGMRHSLVLTEGGDVFSFGEGDKGQLGHGDKKNQCLPKLVEALKGKKVVQVSAGHQHSMALTESGDIFSFGAGDYSQLGHGDRRRHQNLPKLVEALQGKQVVEVQAGACQSVVLTKDERILVSGLSFRGRGNPEWDEELAFDEDGEEIEGYDVPEYLDAAEDPAFGVELYSYEALEAGSLGPAGAPRETTIGRSPRSRRRPRRRHRSGGF